MDRTERPGREEVAAIWGWARQVRAQLSVYVDDDRAQAVAALRQFFATGFAELGGWWRERVLALPQSELHPQVRATRGPGTVSAMLHIDLEPDDSSQSVPFSTEAWTAFVDALADLPARAWLNIETRPRLRHVRTPWRRPGRRGPAHGRGLEG